jgi:hypothetical protein
VVLLLQTAFDLQGDTSAADADRASVIDLEPIE